MDISTGAGAVNVPLTSVTVVTGNATQPCPLCRSGSPSGSACAGTPGSPCTGVCEGSNNQGDACTSTNSTGLSSDCTHLATLRRWPYWLRADIERDPDDPTRCLSITLVADQTYEAIVRDILKRSFSITFPDGGGVVDLPPEPPVRTHRRRW
ncbi:MAG TPA: hypothetical protein VKE41_03375 [Roseiflexaceae bacterium]|nr:hypothetical protein [Roseiflexaceae bacterium]